MAESDKRIFVSRPEGLTLLKGAVFIIGVVVTASFISIESQPASAQEEPTDEEICPYGYEPLYFGDTNNDGQKDLSEYDCYFDHWDCDQHYLIPTILEEAALPSIDSDYRRNLEYGFDAVTCYDDPAPTLEDYRPWIEYAPWITQVFIDHSELLERELKANPHREYEPWARFLREIQPPTDSVATPEETEPNQEPAQPEETEEQPVQEVQPTTVPTTTPEETEEQPVQEVQPTTVPTTTPEETEEQLVQEVQPTTEPVTTAEETGTNLEGTQPEETEEQPVQEVQPTTDPVTAPEETEPNLEDTQPEETEEKPLQEDTGVTELQSEPPYQETDSYNTEIIVGGGLLIGTLATVALLKYLKRRRSKRLSEQ